MYRRFLAVAAFTAIAVTTVAAPALAGHDHYIVTPNGQCHQVAAGQTANDDKGHGGYHRFHVNVHLGATDGDYLGRSNAAVKLFSGATAPPVCFR